MVLLIYIKNNSPDEGIIIEDKSNPEKNITHELKTNEIFNASDLMVDSLTQLLAKEREKKKINYLIYSVTYTDTPLEFISTSNFLCRGGNTL